MTDPLLHAMIAKPLPTADEVLGGVSQGGVPRPACLKDDEDDGSVQSVVPAALRETLNQ